MSVAPSVSGSASGAVCVETSLSASSVNEMRTDTEIVHVPLIDTIQMSTYVMSWFPLFRTDKIHWLFQYFVWFFPDFSSLIKIPWLENAFPFFQVFLVRVGTWIYLSKTRTATGTGTRTRTMETIGLGPCPMSGVMSTVSYNQLGPSPFPNLCSGQCKYAINEAVRSVHRICPRMNGQPCVTSFTVF